MKKKTHRVSNRKIAYLITAMIVLINFITIIVPLFFLYTFPDSKLTFIFFSYPNNLISILGAFFFIYFVITGVFHFTLRVDSYIIEVKSKRTILGFFIKKNNFIEMPKTSVLKYAFYKRYFTFNTTLMVKVKASNKKTIAKRFHLSFLSKKKKEFIVQVLDKIIQKNALDG